MRTLAPLLVASLLVLSACTGADVTGVDDDTLPNDDIDTLPTDDDLSDDNDGVMDQTSSPTASPDTSAESRVIEMTTANWEFSPNAISAKVGEKVVVRIRGVEGRHSFAIPDLNINVPIEPGEVKDIELPTGTAGTFAFRCFIPCGAGHKEMTGTFTVS